MHRAAFRLFARRAGGSGRAASETTTSGGSGSGNAGGQSFPAGSTGSGGGGGGGGGGGDGRNGFFRFSGGYSRGRPRVRFDGDKQGYVVVAVLAAMIGYSFGVANPSHKQVTHGKRGHQQTPLRDVSAFAPDSVQPYVPATSNGAPPTLPVLSTLSPAAVAAHPLLTAIGPFGLPQLPFTPLPGADGADATALGFHLTPPLLLRQSYLTAYNPRTRSADWALEMLSGESDSTPSSAGSNGSQPHASREHSNFKPDPLISPAFQPSSSLYRASGFDRGHLVPAADVPHSDASDGGAQSRLDETFLLSNIAPQHPQLNRGYWLQIEHHLRKLARKQGRTFVITGPLWIPTTAASSNNTTVTNDTALLRTNGSEGMNATAADVIPAATPIGGPPRQQLRVDVLGSGAGAPFLPVPTHFFKVVLLAPSLSDGSLRASDSSLHLAAFLLPNAPVALPTPLSTFQVPLEQIEHYAGWQFFPRIPRHAKQRRASSGVAALLPASFDTSSLPLVRDLCAAGSCELKVKDFQFNHKPAHKAASSE